ncbi:MAG: hybrid sensor histidine kinase/response regulator [Rubrivivax sp.]
MLALRFDRLSDVSTVYVNGQLAARRENQDAHDHVIRSSPALVSVPPALLRPGRNEVLLRVQHGSWRRAGISAVELGPVQAMTLAHDRHVSWTSELPLFLNVVALTFAVMLVLIWLGRRKEVTAGLFGLLSMLCTVRSIGHLASPTLSAAVTDWLFYNAVVACCLLTWLYARHRAGPPYRSLGRAVLLVQAGLAAAAGALAAWSPSWLGILRAVTYPPLLLVLVLAVWIFVVRAWRQRSWDAAAEAAVWLWIVVAAVHDAVYITGRLHPDALFWMPYAAPVLFTLYAATIMQRMLRAMREVEDLRTGLERRVQQRTAELVVANADKSRFLAAASHDLRQPLHAISLLVGLARERMLHPELRLLVERIQSSVDTMGALLKGLLDISRLDAGAVKPALGPVALSEVFAAVRLTEQPLAEAKAIRLRFAPCRALVRSDPRLLESIVRNLVSNAVRYTAQGGVLVGVRRRGGGLLLQVHDTGIGIRQEDQEAIFREFYQVDNPQRDRTQGLGLGLSIVQRTAALLGLPLSLRSTIGAGSMFQLALPLVEAGHALLDDRASAAAGAGLVSAAAVAGSFVVVIEDDLDVRAALVSLLTHWGCHVVADDRADGVLRQLADHLRQPDLLVTDLRLPGSEDGLDAIRRLRAEIDPGLPALVITGDIEPEKLHRLQVDGTPVLFKPLKASMLHEAISAALSRRAPLAANPQP